ncbi:helix-turn-helix transcriptional regulator [Burkholderia mayonis]|uniref:LuxR family transcriptional regulator n=1 Tax=Burkholderia mayonis TaxID=1385591 RepID=A0A1B4G191_9BURK|nr:LuxR C-terminal-related transcriptional regulator [Burkholderia mayonis]AOJ09682.1 LuxR family transcriptional regulator [Burkholderia mayonis]KVE52304.1 LuxR family transcriptional regulator [Burkholderia mayonis]
MEFNRLFAHVGEAILSSGSRRFPRMMYSLIFAALPVDEIRISEFAVDAAPNGGLKVRSIGMVGAAIANSGTTAAPHEPHEPRPSASGRHLHVDDTLACHDQVHALLDRFVRAHAPIAPPCPQFHLATRKRGRYYLISLYRANPFDDFSPQEQTFLKDFAHVLFPIVESHVAALDSDARLEHRDTPAPSPTQTGRERLQRRFAERLLQTGAKLSAREIEACTALLAGDTVPAIAGRFSLRESTVETYLKRAAIKLGVAGRHGLTRWMLDAPGGSAMSMGGTVDAAGARRARHDCASPRIDA